MGLSKRNQSGNHHLSLVKVLATVFLLAKLLKIENSMMTTTSMLYQKSDTPTHGSKRYAVANYVESPDQLMAYMEYINSY